MKKTFYFIILIAISHTFFYCARTSRPDGGPKDETAPLMVTANPPYKTTRFKDTKIKLYFNEYIKLKDVNKQLVISPPMKYPPVISPQGFASNFIEIDLIDTLVKNTTYIFNFGNAIEDNNERNTLERFKYVFSTGNYIDSLKTNGKVKDIIKNKPYTNFNLLLYKIDSSFTDSIIYKKKPNYVTTTTDSIRFNFTNIKKGNYLLVALKEKINDYIYSPKTDEIGFYHNTIQLPKDSVLEEEIKVFKENLPFKFGRPKEVKKGKIIFPFYGKKEHFKIEILSDTPKNFTSVSKYEKDKDTLNYWYKPFEADSLNVVVSNTILKDTFTVRLRKKKLDSLEIRPSTRGLIHLRDTFFIHSNNPLTAIDTTKITLINKDSLDVNFKSFIDTTENKLAIIFHKKPVEQYTLSMLPEAITDLYNFKNDSLQYKISTKELEDYGRITLKVVNQNNKNYIVELLDKKLNLIQRDFINESSTIIYNLLKPEKYIIRAIDDANKNNLWDTGNYLKKVLPEQIIYFNAEDLTLRPNYYLNPIFILDN